MVLYNKLPFAHLEQKGVLFFYFKILSIHACPLLVLTIITPIMLTIVMRIITANSGVNVILNPPFQ